MDMELVELKSTSDENIFMDYLKEETFLNNERIKFWMGITKKDSNWLWNSNNEEVAYDNWAYGEPDRDGDCVVGVDKSYIIWNDVSCYDRYHTFCMKRHSKNVAVELLEKMKQTFNMETKNLALFLGGIILIVVIIITLIVTIYLKKRSRAQ